MLSKELLSDIAEQIKDEMFEQVFGPVLEFKVTPFGAQKVMKIFYPDADLDMLDKFKNRMLRLAREKPFMRHMLFDSQDEQWLSRHGADDINQVIAELEDALDNDLLGNLDDETMDIKNIDPMNALISQVDEQIKNPKATDEERKLNTELLNMLEAT